MATPLRAVKPALKKRLVLEAGNKCANPGCTAWRTHIHHIKQWSVYKSHNSKEMIAICPSCHDAVHNGTLAITNETLYSWKNIARDPEIARAHIYIEPNRTTKLLTGSVALQTQGNNLTVFKFSDNNVLSFSIRDSEICHINIRVATISGREVLRIVDNHLTVNKDDRILVSFRPGYARVTVPATDEYIHQWVVNQMRSIDPSFAQDGRIIAIEIETIKPGLARVSGHWSSASKAVVIDNTRLSFCLKNKQGPICLCGDGEKSVLLTSGGDSPLMNILRI